MGKRGLRKWAASKKRQTSPKSVKTKFDIVRQCSGKKITNPNFWVRISSGGVGVFQVKGWGSKSLVCPPSKARKSNFFGGISRDCCRNIPVAPEKFEKEKVVQFSRRAKKVRNCQNFGPYCRALLCVCVCVCACACACVQACGRAEPKGPRRTKNTTRSKFITRSEFTSAL